MNENEKKKKNKSRTYKYGKRINKNFVNKESSKQIIPGERKNKNELWPNQESK